MCIRDSDIVVQMRMETIDGADGQSRRQRWVSEILHVTEGEKQSGYATSRVFVTDSGSHRVRPGVLPDELRDLTAFGFDLVGYQQELAS